MNPMMNRNSASPELMTSFVVPCIAFMLFVVIKTIRLGIPAIKKQADKTIRTGKTSLKTYLYR